MPRIARLNYFLLIVVLLRFTLRLINDHGRTGLWYPRKKTLCQLVQRTSADHPGVNHHCIHASKVLALVSLAAAIFGTLLGVGKSQTALVALKF